ncbi:hypothetical protein [Bacillus litorisediminis]|uniref:hypothetical protein n=1 Tax=Bacillus litorisediminis TaxID=2922713 RepID=UPI001FAFCD21|nr:hypothetical protein [Bacillus litorisediminis]
MLCNYITSFPKGKIQISSDEVVEVPSLKKFEGEDDYHSNNKLIAYIINAFERQVVLKLMHKLYDVKRQMIDGKKVYIKQNDLEEIFDDDIKPPTMQDNEDPGQRVRFDELITENYTTHEFFKTDEFTFIYLKYKDVLTKNQLEKLNTILRAVEDGEADINDLFRKGFHEGKLNKEEIGKILFPDKENNYRQQAVTNLLNSMKKRMEKALEKEGFKNTVIRSDYEPFPKLSPEENKKYIDYKIEQKYIIKDYYINSLHENINIPYYTQEQIIPQSEIEKIENGKQTVTELIKKYNLKKPDKFDHSPVYTYKQSDSGELTVDVEKLFKSHCRTILEAIADGRVKFKERNGEMVPLNTNKINPLSLDDYRSIKASLSYLYDDEILKIIKRYIKMDKFKVSENYIQVERKIEIKDKNNIKYYSQKNVKYFGS